MRIRGARLFFALPLLCLLAAARPASGQALAAAEALFKKGIDDLDAGKYDTACPALAESQRLDPRPGTLFAFADCREKQGHIATAIALYEDYLRAVDQMTISLKLRHHDRAKAAKARKAALEPEVPELTLTLPSGAPDDVKVVRDGVAFSKATFGVSLPVNPGEHVIQVQVGDGPAHEQRVTLEKREKKTVVLELGAKAAPQAPAPPPSPTQPPAAPASAKPTTTAIPPPKADIPVPPPAGAASPGLGGQRIGALAAAGLGLAGIGLGAAMGAMVLDKKGIIDAHCTQKVCDTEGKQALADAQTPGIVSTVGFGVGAAGLAAAAVLWFTAKGARAPDSKGSVKGGAKMTGMFEIGPDGAAVGVKGAF